MIDALVRGYLFSAVLMADKAKLGGAKLHLIISITLA
jgi:hypothetical protein